MMTRPVILAGFLLALVTTLNLPLSSAHAQSSSITCQSRLNDALGQAAETRVLSFREIYAPRISKTALACNFGDSSVAKKRLPPPVA